MENMSEFWTLRCQIDALHRQMDELILPESSEDLEDFEQQMEAIQKQIDAKEKLFNEIFK